MFDSCNSHATAASTCFFLMNAGSRLWPRILIGWVWVPPSAWLSRRYVRAADGACAVAGGGTRTDCYGDMVAPLGQTSGPARQSQLIGVLEGAENMHHLYDS